MSSDLAVEPYASLRGWKERLRKMRSNTRIKFITLRNEKVNSALVCPDCAPPKFGDGTVD